MIINNKERKNAEGYDDPSVYNAIKNVENVTEKEKPYDEGYERFRKLLKMIFEVCELADFHVEERMVLRDRRSGKVWK